MPKRRKLTLIDEDKATGVKVYEKRTKALPKNWKNGVDTRRALANAFAETNGNIAETCKRVGVNLRTFYYHKSEYPEFRMQLEMIEDAQIDVAQQALLDLVQDKHFGAIKYILDKRGEARGYGDKVKTEHKETRDINVNFSYETVKSDKQQEVREAMEAEIVEHNRKLEEDG